MTNMNYLNLTLFTFAKGQLESLKTAFTSYLQWKTKLLNGYNVFKRFIEMIILLLNPLTQIEMLK